MPSICFKVPDQLNIERKKLCLSWMDLLEAGMDVKKNPCTINRANIRPLLVAASKAIKAADDLLKGT